MITLEELYGFFPEDDSIYIGGDYILHVCHVCYATILTTNRRDHIRWHKGESKADKDKTPEEIQQEAKRILADIRRWET